MWTTSSGDSLFNEHPFGTFDAGSGRRPPHHSRRFRDVGRESAFSPLTDITSKTDRVGKVPYCDINLNGPRQFGSDREADGPQALHEEPYGPTIANWDN
jgi:hypothetical protein